MSKKTKNKELNQINDLVKKVKNLFLETVVREWLNTPLKEWKYLTPLQIIKKGDGQELLDAIKKADEELKNEREENKHGPVEEVIEQETILSRIDGP